MLHGGSDSADRQTTPPVPRLRFDLLAQLAINSSKQNAPEDYGAVIPDQTPSLDDDRKRVLPVIHASTSRERGASKADQHRSREDASAAAHTARIRYAPPPFTSSPSQPSKPDVRPPLGHKRPSNQLKTTTPRDEEDETSACAVMKQMVTEKQEITARCFQALHELQTRSQSGSTKAILHQIYCVLYDAAYNYDQIKGLPTIGGLAPEESSNDIVTPEESVGQEYFSLLLHSQEKLRSLQQEETQLRTKVAMEQALERNLAERLQTLDEDLEHIRCKHGESNGQIEIEWTAVNQLEHEYGMLLNQEHEAKHECEVLNVQVEKQKLQLKDIRTKVSYLEFVSRIPIKKHLEERKVRDQEEGLLLKVNRVDEENAKLEAELARLNLQVENLDRQYQQDFEKKTNLETTLRDAGDELERIESVCRRTRDCHTPRPSWDVIVDQTPELSHQKYQWEILDDSCNEESSRDDLDLEVNMGSEAREAGVADQQLHSSDSGRTKKLVKEMLHWIERLQKHCGVNLHLSRVRPPLESLFFRLMW